MFYTDAAMFLLKELPKQHKVLSFLVILRATAFAWFSYFKLVDRVMPSICIETAEISVERCYTLHTCSFCKFGY